jgi:hypothetical protein
MSLAFGESSRPNTYALVRQYGCAVDVELVLDGHVVTQDGDVFHSALNKNDILAFDSDISKHELRTHRPTVLFHPIIELMIHAWSRMLALFIMTHR